MFVRDIRKPSKEIIRVPVAKVSLAHHWRASQAAEQCGASLSRGKSTPPSQYWDHLKERGPRALAKNTKRELQISLMIGSISNIMQYH